MGDHGGNLQADGGGEETNLSMMVIQSVLSKQPPKPHEQTGICLSPAVFLWTVMTHSPA